MGSIPITRSNIKIRLSLDKADFYVGARFFEKLCKNDADAIRLVNEMCQNKETRTFIGKLIDTIKEIIFQLKKAVNILRGKGEYRAARQVENTIKNLGDAKAAFVKAF